MDKKDKINVQTVSEVIKELESEFKVKNNHHISAEPDIDFNDKQLKTLNKEIRRIIDLENKKQKKIKYRIPTCKKCNPNFVYTIIEDYDHSNGSLIDITILLGSFLSDVNHFHKKLKNPVSHSKLTIIKCLKCGSRIKKEKIITSL